MELNDAVIMMASIVFGYSFRALTTELKYPTPKHKWNCARCPARIGASDKAVLDKVAADHMNKVHGVQQ